jgi:endonuclease/exonuclease/phosphatase family metal-dependent hydrolase
MMTRRRRRIGLLGAVLSAVIVCSGAARWPTGPAEGGPIAPPSRRAAVSPPLASDGEHLALPMSYLSPDAAPTRLRLATLNIHSGIGTDDHWDLGRTAELLKGYDLISLHECRGSGPWWSNNVDDLSSRTGLTGLFAPTEVWWWRPWFGNGLLTDTRIDRWTRTPLPTGDRMAFRNVLHLEVPFGSGTLNVLMVHMAKKSDRARDFAIVADMFRQLPKPAIMMGDMNTRPNDPIMQQLLQSGDVEDPVGQRLTYPRDRVDFILTRGVKWNDAGLVENKATDHPLVWVEVEAAP